MRFNIKYIKINTILFLITFLFGFIGIYLYSENIPVQNDLSHDLIVNNVYFLEIFKKNFLVCAIAILGIVTFRISNVIVLIANGLFLGIIIGANFATTGELVYFLRILIPHAIFELPAIILSCTVGMEGFSFLKRYTNKEKIINLTLITGLLIIAAFVEVNISTLLI